MAGARMKIGGNPTAADATGSTPADKTGNAGAPVDTGIRSPLTRLLSGGVLANAMNPTESQQDENPIVNVPSFGSMAFKSLVSQKRANDAKLAAASTGPAYTPPSEARASAADIQSVMDFQANASRRKAASGTSLLSSAGANAGTKTLLGA